MRVRAAKEDIRRIDFDNAKNTVTISGRFDPAKMSKKLRCKACDVIKGIKIKPQEEKKPAEEKTKKPEAKKPEEKQQPEDKKPAEEKTKKPEEKKPAEEKKKKPEEKKGGGDEKAKAAPPPPPPSSSSNTTLNLQFTNMCGICYPWPCSDPAAHWGIHHHHPQQMMPQWPPCGGMAPAPLPAPVHHPHPPCGGGAPQKWAPCGGPSFCGGCGWCHGGGMRGGWAPAAAQPMCCPGPSLCRGCNGCKIVHETKFSYEEYPSSACAIM
jgi:hypothetical protein